MDTENPYAARSGTPHTSHTAPATPPAHSPAATAATETAHTDENARPGCRPPYVIDPNGIKRVKPECL
jgi:hypothetical protein